MRVARWLTGTAAAVLAVGLGAGPAAACGFLVAPNGAVDLIRTTTLASWSDGVEHYVTSFEFASEEPSFGSIIPLPSEPTNVERGGDWTLQRLRREIPGETTATTAAAATTAAPASAQVIREVQIDALNKGVTVEKSERATSLLLNDLRNDQNSSWIPQAGYLTHVAIKAKAGDVKRDLVTQPAVTPQAQQNDPVAKTTTQRDDPARYVAVALGGILLGAIVVSVSRRHTTPPPPPNPPADA